MSVEGVLRKPVLEILSVEVRLVGRINSLVVVLRVVISHRRDDQGVREGLGESVRHGSDSLLQEIVVACAGVSRVERDTVGNQVARDQDSIDVAFFVLNQLEFLEEGLQKSNGGVASHLAKGRIYDTVDDLITQ